MVDETNTLEETPIVKEAPVDILNMSDDELDKFDFSTIDDQTVTEEPEEEVITEEEETVTEEETNESDEDTDTVDTETETSTDTETETTKEETDSTKVDYEAAYKKLTSPFKANGKEMQVDNVDDALTLMQMGANYNKKMAGLKPNLKLLKMLENNGLLDENKLNFLIDLDKKDPNAIQKLIKDSGIDPLEVDTNSDTDYKPKTYAVDDKEVELDEVLADISDSPSYQDTINIIANKWDDASKRILLSNPQAIKVINDQVANGIYGKITQVVENQRMLGRLGGITDIEAYRQIGDQMAKAGAFNESTPTTANVTPDKSKPKIDAELKSKKRAASSTKGAAPNRANPSNFNPLSMSDDEFEKINPKFI